AYMIYTSGSTGRPKGVIVSHESLVAQITWLQRCYGLSTADRVLQFAAPTFDVALGEILGTLLAGATLVLRTDAWLESAGAFWASCARHRVTVVDLPVRFAALLIGDVATPIAPSVRRVVTGGEAVPTSLLAAWCARPEPRPVLQNGYGPTEATIAATARVITPEPATWSSIGGPLANVRTYVLDARGEPVPIGVAGELCIGGVQVARGYWRRAGLTATQFVPDPFGSAGSRLYRTGDLVRWRADGELDFLGRTDDQVKLRGYRIEPGEIETVLAAHPAVAHAVVVARDDAAGERQLVAYYVPSGPPPSIETVQTYLAGRLTAYMVPAAYVLLETLPLTPSGKIDRTALPAPDGDAYQRQVYEAPVGQVETALAAMWVELLGIERVGRQDDFFALGGHSLLAVRLVTRTRHVLGGELGVADVFRAPTLAEFARVVIQATRVALPAIATVPRDTERGIPLEAPPLSFAQQRLWFLEQMGGLGSTYHMTWQCRLIGALDRVALRRALDRIVQRHEALRTTFVMVDGEPVQHIAPAAASAFMLRELDLRDHGPSADATAELQRLVRDEAQTAFVLSRGPLIRGLLIGVSPIGAPTDAAAPEHAIVVTMHHVVSDGWSIGLFVNELRVLYDAFRRSESDPLPPVAVQYADYAAWQQRVLTQGGLAEQLAYWQTTLAGSPELLDLPTDHPRPTEQDHGGELIPIRLDAALTRGLEQLSARRGMTMFMTVLAGWAVVLSRLSGQTDIVIGTPTANRSRLEIEPLIGFFVNTLALRLDLAGGPTIDELLERVKGRALGAQQHQDVPFEQVVQEVKPARSLAHSPVFQVMFMWQSATRDGERFSLPGITVKPLGETRRVNAMFDLTLTLAEVGGQLVGAIDYATALWERATIERHLGYLTRVLTAMVEAPETPVPVLPLLGAAEREKLLVGWSSTTAATETPSDALPGDAVLGVTSIHELIEAQVARTPDAAAVTFEDETVTYAKLNARANQLAFHLRTVYGVGPESRVALCMERSIDLVVAVLAVFKAGGAYVPLDSGYPAERLRYMLTDSRPAVVLISGDDGLAIARTLDGTLGEATPLAVVDVAMEADRWAAAPTTDVATTALGLRPANVAYVLYTSGSTGRPKGVVVTHEGLVSELAGMQSALRLGASDRFLATSTVAFDVTVLELLQPLLTAGRVMLMPRGVNADPAALAARLRLTGATVLQATPTTWRALCDLPWDGQPGLQALCGGEALPTELAERMRQRVGRLWNVYGPTEISIWGTALAVEEGAGAASGVVPIGR
ncbi:MAG: amino acid adenylation domain-containing protein, partial [Gemmatimonadaceae bacterium]